MKEIKFGLKQLILIAIISVLTVFSLVNFIINIVNCSRLDSLLYNDVNTVVSEQKENHIELKKDDITRIISEASGYEPLIVDFDYYGDIGYMYVLYYNHTSFTIDAIFDAKTDFLKSFQFYLNQDEATDEDKEISTKILINVMGEISYSKSKDEIVSIVQDTLNLDTDNEYSDNNYVGDAYTLSVVNNAPHSYNVYLEISE